MPHLNAIAIFSDDLRSEAGGRDSIMGIFPDNVKVPSVPCLFPKLCIYIRFLMTIDRTYPGIEIFLQFDDGTAHSIGDISKELIDSEFKKAKDEKKTTVGFISKAIASPFPINAGGKILVVAKFGDEEVICGLLNVVVDPQAAIPSATASALPA